MTKQVWIIEVTSPDDLDQAVRDKISSTLFDQGFRLSDMGASQTYIPVSPSTTQYTPNAEDAIFRVVDDVRALLESSTQLGFAQNLIDLQNSASDLATWHTAYDARTGCIKRPVDGDEG